MHQCAHGFGTQNDLIAGFDMLQTVGQRAILDLIE